MIALLLAALLADNVPPSLARVMPEVHSVTVEDGFVVIRSAGVSMHYFGPLQGNPNSSSAPKEYTFRIPRNPAPAAGKHPAAPTDITGVFVNGMPVHNPFQASYQGANLWHYDPLAVPGAHGNAPGLLEQLAANGCRQSPIIGYALDGFPIYGPWGFGGNGLQRMRSSYRLRDIRARTTWADGTKLTPAQYGPEVSAENPVGTFAEDYEYVAGSGDLDEFNGRFANGTYAYFLSADQYPYLLAGHYYGEMPRPAPPAAVVAERDGMTLRADTAHPKAAQPVRLSFAVPNPTLEYVHERPIHLLIVSADLAEFAHVHPELNGDAYELTYTFPHGGHYRAYADFTPPGSETRVEAFDFMVEGAARTPEMPQPASLNVTMHADAPLRAGYEVTLHFGLPDTDLEPYLGAWAHFVVIQEGLQSFQHAHPLDGAMKMAHCAMASGAPPSEVKTVVSFAKPGKYKLWAQFQRRGEVVTVPFVLRVGN